MPSAILSSPFVSLGEGDYHAQLANTPGCAVVLFSHAHCGACRTWKRLLPEALSPMTVHFYEVDVALATGMARYFDIFHLPTIFLYQDGHFHAELQAAAHADAVLHEVLALYAAPAQEEP